MKHNFNITLTIILLFFLSQFFGLVIIDGYIDHQTTTETGNITYTALPMNLERPEVEESISYMYIITAVLIATAIVYLLFKFKKTNWWRTWFFLAVFLGLTIAFNVFLGTYIAAALALILAFYKVFRQNIIVHNITELFIYGGIAAIFVPIMNLQSIAILLVLISIYDMIAVWQSKHMIKLAKFQTGAKAFAGISLPYALKKGKAKFIRQVKKSEKNLKKVKVKSAILGGGDIIFPLIFAGVILKTIMLTNEYLIGFLKTLTIPIFVSIALFLLLIKAKKDKFYPAMPFLSLGCLAGFIVMLIFGWV
jgi:presenilin-like A22 family membrane protease